MSPQPRPNLVQVNARVDGHENRIDALEVRLAKYDVILERLDVLINVLTENMRHLTERAENAIDGQEVLRERNEGTHRWSAFSIALATGIIVGVLCFVVGYILH